MSVKVLITRKICEIYITYEKKTLLSTVPRKAIIYNSGHIYFVNLRRKRAAEIPGKIVHQEEPPLHYNLQYVKLVSVRCMGSLFLKW